MGISPATWPMVTRWLLQKGGPHPILTGTATPTAQPYTQSMVLTQVDTGSQSTDSGSTQGEPGRDQKTEMNSDPPSLRAQTLHPLLSHFTSSPFTPPHASKSSGIPTVLGKLWFQESDLASGVFLSWDNTRTAHEKCWQSDFG